MHAAPGLGLSAPQVNVGKRLITVDLSIGERADEVIVLINPEIISREGKVVREEGCLSVPEIYEKVARPQKIVIKGLDLEGNESDDRSGRPSWPASSATKSTISTASCSSIGSPRSSGT